MPRRHLRQGCLALLLVCLAPVYAGMAYADPAIPLELTGPLEQGSLVIGRTEPDARVRFEGEPVRVSTDGVFLIGFGRDAEDSARLTVAMPDGRTLERTLEVARRDYEIQRIEGVEQEKVTPPEEVWPRIREETRLITRARQKDEPRTDFLADFRWPVEGPITGVYGSQRFYNGEPRRPHYGIDIAAPGGTVVHAPAPGVITVAYPDMYFSGGTILLDHGHGLTSAFLHMRELYVEVGDAVAQGDPLGEVGSLGRSTGAHLDWRINLFGRRLDPAYLVGDMPDTKTASSNE